MSKAAPGESQRVWLKLIAGIALFLAILLPDGIPSIVEGGKPLEGVAQRAFAASALVAFWWMTGPVALAATSLIPLALFPLLGVMSAKEVSSAYVNDSIHLYMGGFIIALGIERWKLHRRIALWVLVLVGSGPRRVILGMMSATALLSMWISNTATTLLMLPIAMALVDSFESHSKSKSTAKFGTALLLGIAYASSAGGAGTLVGTPTNMVFVGMSAEHFPEAPPISFANWFLVFSPFSVVMVLLMWWIMAPKDQGDADQSSLGREVIRAELKQLGPMSTAEKRMFVVFLCTAVLWIFRASIVIGDWKLPGWSEGFEVLAHRLGWVEFQAKSISDATVALGMVAVMFFFPAGDAEDPSQRLMDWETAVKLPWGILLLIGGGFAIAKTFESAGVSSWVGDQFMIIADWPPLAMVAGICFGMTFLTEITSNVATTAVTLPILASSSKTLGVHPWLLMLPATISASCAFMLPVATPPNAIVFGSGRVQMADMVRYGILINLVGVVVVTAVVYLLAVPILGIDPNSAPSWAH